MGGVRPVRLIQRLGVAMAMTGLTVAACSSGPPATPTPGPAGQPTVVIESPVSGSPTTVGQPLIVQARADDIVGVNRVDLRIGDILVTSESTPGGVPQTTFLATLQYTPSADGAVTLSVVAYRPDGTASQPATITVAVVLAGVSPDPDETPSSSTPDVAPTASPAVTPTAAARPTLPPFATPTASPSPSPSPSPTPIALDMRVQLEEEELPDPWVMDTQYTLNVYVFNDGPVAAPPMSVRVRLCNPGGGCGTGDADETITTSQLDPGTALDYSVTVTPEMFGDRVLRARIFVPEGYVDPNPANNIWQHEIFVEAPGP